MFFLCSYSGAQFGWGSKNVFFLSYLQNSINDEDILFALIRHDGRFRSTRFVNYFFTISYLKTEFVFHSFLSRTYSNALLIRFFDAAWICLPWTIKENPWQKFPFNSYVHIQTRRVIEWKLYPHENLGINKKMNCMSCIRVRRTNRCVFKRQIK